MSATTLRRPTSISFRAPHTSPKVEKMSMTQTYYLAHKARAKLSREAAQPDHDLRFLVGHANLLDNLMLELAQAERDQERWFNQSVRRASYSQTKKQQERHVQWSENLAQVPEEDSSEEEDEYEEDDLEEDYEQLELVRTSSRSNSPPELVNEESDSEDDEMPRSPPQIAARLATPATKNEQDQSDEEESLYKESYYLPNGNSPTTITVY